MIIIAIMTIHHGHLDHHDYFDHSWKNADASVLFFKPVVIFVVIFCFFTCKKCVGHLCRQVEHKLWSKDLLFYAHCNMNSVCIMLVLSIHLVPRFFAPDFCLCYFQTNIFTKYYPVREWLSDKAKQWSDLGGINTLHKTLFPDVGIMCIIALMSF